MRDVSDQPRVNPDDYQPELTKWASKAFTDAVRGAMRLHEPPLPAIEEALPNQSRATQVLSGVVGTAGARDGATVRLASSQSAVGARMGAIRRVQEAAKRLDATAHGNVLARGHTMKLVPLDLSEQCTSIPEGDELGKAAAAEGKHVLIGAMSGGHGAPLTGSGRHGSARKHPSSMSLLDDLGHTVEVPDFSKGASVPPPPAHAPPAPPVKAPPSSGAPPPPHTPPPKQASGPGHRRPLFGDDDAGPGYILPGKQNASSPEVPGTSPPHAPPHAPPPPSMKTPPPPRTPPPKQAVARQVSGPGHRRPLFGDCLLYTSPSPRD